MKKMSGLSHYEPLCKKFFTPEPVVPQPVPSAPAPVQVHPLEGKSWFRLAKVLYIGLGILVVLLCAFLMVGGVEVPVALGVAVLAGLVLVAIQKGFYYVTLGRTTAVEKPGTGFFDLDELRQTFGNLLAENPDMYQSVVVPYLDAWKTQYGRRVPAHAFDPLLKRAQSEMEKLKEKKDKVLKETAEKGGKLELANLRARMEKTKAEYVGNDREGFVRGIDAWLIKLEAQYGTSIPVDVASNLADELDESARARERASPSS